MNRSAVVSGRLLMFNLKKIDKVFIPSVKQSKCYHLAASSRQDLLTFSPSSISVDLRRTLFSSKESEDKEAKKEAEDEAAEISEAEKAYQEQIAGLEEKNADLLDKYRRSLADFENLRNRMNKQVICIFQQLLT